MNEEIDYSQYPTTLEYVNDKLLPQIPPNFVADVKGISNSLSGKVVPSEPVPSSGDKEIDALAKLAAKGMLTYPMNKAVFQPLVADLLMAYPTTRTIASVALPALWSYGIVAGRAENEGNSLTPVEKLKELGKGFVTNYITRPKPKAEKDNKQGYALKE